MEPQKIIETQELTKKYGHQAAVENLTFQVDEGDISPPYDRMIVDHEDGTFHVHVESFDDEEKRAACLRGREQETSVPPPGILLMLKPAPISRARYGMT